MKKRVPFPTCPRCGGLLGACDHEGEATAIGRPAQLCLQGWDGYSEQPIEVIGETRTRYRIRALDKMVKLGGSSRWLAPRDTALVPKRAVKLGASIVKKRRT